MLEPAISHSPLDGLPAREDLGLSAAPAAVRHVFRGGPEAVLAVGAAFGAPLPRQACRSSSASDRRALWLGPDEWLLLSPLSDDLGARLNTLLGALPHSLVEISQRQTGLEVSGARAVHLLAAACPLDLDISVFPIGMCTRTVMGKSEVVLWRTGAQAFHLEVWRSFAVYVWRLLEAAGLDLAAD